MKFFARYYISLLLLLLVYSCSIEPIETGPFYSGGHLCDLNGVFYYDGIEYNAWCNPEGVKLFDSLKRESDFVGQFFVDEICSENTIRIRYNTYTGFFQFMKSNVDCKRGNNYVLGIDAVFFSGENYFQTPSRCVFTCGESSVVDTIPSDFFSIDPVKSLEDVTTCEDKIAVFQSFYEIREKARNLSECIE